MRATVVEALYRMAGEPDASEVVLPFTDIQGNEYFIDSLKWAYREGVVNGYSENMYVGLAAVPRQQLATMLYRAAKLGGEVAEYDESLLEAFADSANVAGWAREAMIWAVGEGILGGDNADCLNPTGNTTRAELAQIIMNILNKK